MRIWKERLWKGTELDIFKRTTNTYINSEEAVQSLPEPLLASFSQIRDEISLYSWSYQNSWRWQEKEYFSLCSLEQVWNLPLFTKFSHFSVKHCCCVSIITNSRIPTCQQQTICENIISYTPQFNWISPLLYLIILGSLSVKICSPFTKKLLTNEWFRE